MAEPHPTSSDGELPDTLPTTPEGDLFVERSGVIRELGEVRTMLAGVQRRLANSHYGDVSMLGADRARLDIASRALNEVACHVADLTFDVAPDRDREPREIPVSTCQHGCFTGWDKGTRVSRVFRDCPVHGNEKAA